MKHIWVMVFVLSLIACSTVTINPKPTGKLVSKPTYEESKNFYWWSLVGEHRINVQKICVAQDVVQMQSQMTFEDAVFTFITLGIYAPHTVKVWCG